MPSPSVGIATTLAILCPSLASAANGTALDSKTCAAHGFQPGQQVPPLNEPSHQEPTNAAAASQQRPWKFSWEKGLEGGWRQSLEDRGIRFNLFFNDQYQAVAKGGLDTNGGRNSASMDAFLMLDLGRLGWIDNADALLHLQSNWGAGVNNRVGSLADVNDDADGDLGLHVAQLWYRHRFLESRVSLTTGFLDFQTIVDRNAFANSEDKQFWNQALDNNPLVPLGIGLGAWAEIQPTSWWTINLGAIDAQSELYETGFSTAFHEEAWFLAYAETTFKPNLPSKRGPLAGNYRIGLVYDPRQRNGFPLPRRDPESRGDDYGEYVSVDQKLFRENEKDDQGLGVFGRFGYRTPETNRIGRFWSAGFSYTGLIPKRDADVLGFGFALQRPSGLYRSRVDSEFDNEAVYELYYAIQLNKWLVITPDVQYVENPGGSNDGKPAVVAGVRVRASF